MPASSGWLPLTSSSELFIKPNSQFTYKRRHTYTVKSCQISTIRWTVFIIQSAGIKEGVLVLGKEYESVSHVLCGINSQESSQVFSKACK